MTKRTVLYHKHLDAGARMVDFAGWEMPLNYGSQLTEHRQVREHAGVFDVSHMTIVDISGAGAVDYLRHLLANDVAKLDVPGRALYSAMLNESGGVVDDLIVYRMERHYRVVLNCATREKDLQWLARHAVGFAVELRERPELAILAVHGPRAIGIVSGLLPPDQADRVRALGNFRAVEFGEWCVARTGYTGEKGLELMIPAAAAAEFWDKLLAAGVSPVGLGARDTLRLEAGMNLYGHDMDETTSPLAANMEQTISWEPADRNFIGREALVLHRQLQQEGRLPHMVGLVLQTRGVLREGQRVVTDKGEGIITSGTFSPTLKVSIALARVPVHSTISQVEMRGGLAPVRMVRPGFVRFGKPVFEHKA